MEKKREFTKVHLTGGGEVDVQLFWQRGITEQTSVQNDKGVIQSEGRRRGS